MADKKEKKKTPDRKPRSLHDEAIKGAILLRILLMTLKYISTPGLNYKLRGEIFPLFLELKDKKKGTEYLEVLLRYLTRSARGIFGARQNFSKK